MVEEESSRVTTTFCGGYTAAESTAGWASVGGHFTAVGHFYNTAEFGPWRLTSPGDSGLVVWRVSGEGTSLWAVAGGGTGDDNLHSVVSVGRRRGNVCLFPPRIYAP